MAAILAAAEGMPAGARLLWGASASGDYPVYIGRGLVTGRVSGRRRFRGRRFLVTDGAVGRLYAERLEPLDGRVVIMPGEQSKTIAHAEIVWSELARAGMTRSDLVVALGGGVVGDLAGFCAATYQRGVRYVQVPTTLVAQVDSAYGGKTGVDLEEAKNYVGAYHQPQAVIADPDVLASLPAAELAAGYAEVVKTALIAGGSLWDLVRGGAEPDDQRVIAACALTKLRVVARDERDDGLRQVLNLGHTVGHAIETVTRYARLPPRGGGRARAARRAAALGPGRAARRGGRAVRRPGPAGRPGRGRSRRGRDGHRPGQEAPRARGRSRSCCSTRRAPPSRGRGAPRDLIAAVRELAELAGPARRARMAVAALDARLAGMPLRSPPASRSCTASTSTSSAGVTRATTGAWA